MATKYRVHRTNKGFVLSKKHTSGVVYALNNDGKSSTPLSWHEIPEGVQPLDTVIMFEGDDLLGHGFDSINFDRTQNDSKTNKEFLEAIETIELLKKKLADHKRALRLLASGYGDVVETLLTFIE